MKFKFISKISFLILLFLVICFPCVFEFILYQDKEELKSQAYGVMHETFNELGKENIIAISYTADDLDDIEVMPHTFPDIPKEDKYLSKYWNKEFKDIDTLYSISGIPWEFTGFMSTLSIYLNNEGLCCYGIREYKLRPGFVGIKKGCHFSKKDFYNALKKAYQIFANNTDNVNYFVDKVLGYRNKLYSYAGRFDADCERNKIFPSSGIMKVEPIFYNGKFDGKYNYLHIDEGSCRVYIIMAKTTGWKPELDEKAVLIKRCIWYGIIELPLFIFALFVGIRLFRRNKHVVENYKRSYK